LKVDKVNFKTAKFCQTFVHLLLEARVHDGHRPRVGFGRAIIGLEVAVNIALRPFSKVSSGTSGSVDKSPLVWQSSHSKP
jgi:hypothetical protein